MKRTIDIRPLAETDLVECADFIAIDNLDAAIRFLECCRDTFDYVSPW